MGNRGSALVGALVFVSVLGFLWVSDFAVRLTDRIQTERTQAMEDRHAEAAALEWEALETELASILPEDSPAVIEYWVVDGLSERRVRLKATWTGSQWQLSERHAVWRAMPVSH